MYLPCNYNVANKEIHVMRSYRRSHASYIDVGLTRNNLFSWKLSRNHTYVLRAYIASVMHALTSADCRSERYVDQNILERTDRRTNVMWQIWSLSFFQAWWRLKATYSSAPTLATPPASASWTIGARFNDLSWCTLKRFYPRTTYFSCILLFFPLV